MGEERASAKLYGQLVNDIDALSTMRVVLPRVIHLKPEIYRLRAEVEWEVGDAISSIEWFNKAEKCIEQERNYYRQQSRLTAGTPKKAYDVNRLGKTDGGTLQLLRAEARHSVGQIHEAIEEYQLARSMLRNLIDLDNNISPDDAPSVYYRNLALANVLEGHCWLNLEQFEQAGERYQAAYDMVPKVLAMDEDNRLWDVALGSKLPRTELLNYIKESKKSHMFGFTNHFLGRFLVVSADHAGDPTKQRKQGITHLQQALMTRRNLSNGSPKITSYRRDVGLSLSELAKAYIEMEQHELALEHVNEAIEVLSELCRLSQRLEPHLRYAEALEIRGDLFVNANQPDKANACYRQAIDQCATVLGVSPSRWDCQQVLQRCRDKLTEVTVVSSGPDN